MNWKSVVVTCLIVAAFAAGTWTRVAQAGGPTSNAASGPLLLKLVTKNPEIQTVDVGTPGESHGDMRVLNAELYDAGGTRRIGEYHHACTVTNAPDQPGETQDTTQCLSTFRLPGGDIMTMQLNHRTSVKVSGPGARYFAIIGGTRAYRMARGDGEGFKRSDTVFTFTLYIYR